MKKKWLIIAGIAVILLVIAVIIVTNIGSSRFDHEGEREVPNVLLVY